MKRGFTLIELLVVIAIIAVLLALLTPALDKAIYQAELAVCEAHQKGVVGAVGIYAVDFQRRYPPRSTQGQVAANVLAFGALHPADPYFDDRPPLKDYLSLKMMLCPLTRAIDLERTKIGSVVFPSYCLYYSWKFTGPAGGGDGRMKLGDAFSFQGQRLRAITVDWDRISAPDVQWLGGHPDRDGAAVNIARQDEPAVVVAAGAGAINQVISFWFLNGQYQRSNIDLNAGYEDGSVARFNDVRWDEWSYETGMVKVPAYANGASFESDYYVHIPKN